MEAPTVPSLEQICPPELDCTTRTSSIVFVGFAQENSGIIVK